MKLFQKKPPLPPEKAMRVPPGQYLTEKWPVLHYGPVPIFDARKWDFRVFGRVQNELRWTWDELKKIDEEQRALVTADMHCVTTWSRLDQKWEGIPFNVVVERAKADRLGATVPRTTPPASPEGPVPSSEATVSLPSASSATQRPLPASRRLATAAWRYQCAS
jgi:DMSO/TMAO reductase YedYZ molybdopterin-dependent catalytic subunit